MGIGPRPQRGDFKLCRPPRPDGRRGAAARCIADFRASLGHRVLGAGFDRALSRRRESRVRRGPATDQRTTRCRPAQGTRRWPPQGRAGANVPEASGTRGSSAPPSGLRSPRSGAWWSRSEGTAARLSRRRAEATRPRGSAGLGWLCRHSRSGSVVRCWRIRAPQHLVDPLAVRRQGLGRQPSMGRSVLPPPLALYRVRPGTGRICLIRSVVVRTLLTGGAENAA